LLFSFGTCEVVGLVLIVALKIIESAEEEISRNFILIYTKERFGINLDGKTHQACLLIVSVFFPT